MKELTEEQKTEIRSRYHDVVPSLIEHLDDIIAEVIVGYEEVYGAEVREAAEQFAGQLILGMFVDVLERDQNGNKIEHVYRHQEYPKDEGASS